MRRLWALCAGVAIWGGSAWADPNLEFQFRYWMPVIDGVARITDGGGAPSNVNFRNDLAIGDNNIPEGRIWWSITPQHHLRMSYHQVGYKGSTVLARTINFAGSTYAAGTLVNSKVDLKTFDIGYGYTFGRDESIELRSLFDIRIMALDAAVNAPGPPAINESQKITVPLPTVGVMFDAKLHEHVGLFGEVNAMTAGKYGYLVDAELGLKLKPWERFQIVGGWRLFDFEGRDPNDNDFVRTMVAGPFINIYGVW